MPQSLSLLAHYPKKSENLTVLTIIRFDLHRDKIEYKCLGISLYQFSLISFQCELRVKLGVISRGIAGVVFLLDVVVRRYYGLIIQNCFELFSYNSRLV